MSLIEALFYVIGFFTIYGTAVVVVWGLDKVLHRVIGKGLFPKEYWW